MNYPYTPPRPIRHWGVDHAVKLRSYIPYELTGARDCCVTYMSSGFFLVN